MGLVLTTLRRTSLACSSSFKRSLTIFLLAPSSWRASSLKRTGPSLRCQRIEPVHFPPRMRMPRSMAHGSAHAFVRILRADLSAATIRQRLRCGYKKYTGRLSKPVAPSQATSEGSDHAVNPFPTPQMETGSMQAKLFTPLELGDLTLPNRVVMAPLTRNRADPEGDVPYAMHAEYYAQRASAGLIITEG